MLLTAQIKLPFWVIQKFLHCLLFQSKKLVIVRRVVAGVIFCFVQSCCIMMFKLISRSSISSLFSYGTWVKTSQNNVKHQGGVCSVVQL